MGSWLTTGDLLDKHGITRANAMSQVDLLERVGLAKNIRGTWLFSPLAVCRIHRRPAGRQPLQPTWWQVLTIESGWKLGDSVDKLSRDLGVSWRVMNRWVIELGLKGGKCEAP